MFGSQFPSSRAFWSDASMMCFPIDWIEQLKNASYWQWATLSGIPCTEMFDDFREIGEFGS